MTPPVCDHCGRPMQLNTSVDNQRTQHFICGCTGIVHHVNVVPMTRKWIEAN